MSEPLLKVIEEEEITGPGRRVRVRVEVAVLEWSHGELHTRSGIAHANAISGLGQMAAGVARRAVRQVGARLAPKDVPSPPPPSLSAAFDRARNVAVMRDREQAVPSKAQGSGW